MIVFPSFRRQKGHGILGSLLLRAILFREFCGNYLSKFNPRLNSWKRPHLVAAGSSQQIERRYIFCILFPSRKQQTTTVGEHANFFLSLRCPDKRTSFEVLFLSCCRYFYFHAKPVRHRRKSAKKNSHRSDRSEPRRTAELPVFVISFLLSFFLSNPF